MFSIIYGILGEPERALNIRETGSGVYLKLIQVCSMSQSWDNVAINMHELLTVSSHTQRKSKQYHLPSYMSTMRMQQHELSITS